MQVQLGYLVTWNLALSDIINIKLKHIIDESLTFLFNIKLRCSLKVFMDSCEYKVLE